MLYSSFESLDELVATLPFHLDDIPSINATYLHWHASGDAHEREVIQLWTYCFIRRYFLVKFIQEASWSAVDLDMLIETAFRKTEAREAQIREPSRYASWVSVVCKNTFRNYLRSRRHHIPIEHAPSLSLRIIVCGDRATDGPAASDHSRIYLQSNQTFAGRCGISEEFRIK